MSDSGSGSSNGNGGGGWDEAGALLLSALPDCDCLQESTQQQQQQQEMADGGGGEPVRGLIAMTPRWNAEAICTSRDHAMFVLCQVGGAEHCWVFPSLQIARTNMSRIVRRFDKAYRERA